MEFDIGDIIKIDRGQNEPFGWARFEIVSTEDGKYLAIELDGMTRTLDGLIFEVKDGVCRLIEFIGETRVGPNKIGILGNLLARQTQGPLIIEIVPKPELQLFMELLQSS